MARLAEAVEVSFWEKLDDTRTVIRLAASWASSEADTERLVAVLKEHAIAR